MKTRPEGWEDRLVEVPECPNTKAIAPGDLAAVKLLVGRPKDLELVKTLTDKGLIKIASIEKSVSLLEVPVESKPRLMANLNRLKD